MELREGIFARLGRTSDAPRPARPFLRFVAAGHARAPQRFLTCFLWNLALRYEASVERPVGVDDLKLVRIGPSNYRRGTWPYAARHP